MPSLKTIGEFLVGAISLIASFITIKNELDLGTLVDASSPVANLLPWLLVLLFAFIAGWMFRGLLRSRRKSRDINTQITAQNRDAIKHLDINLKALIKAAREHGFAYIRKDDWDIHNLYGESDFYGQFFDWEYIEGNRVKLSLNQNTSAFFDDNTDLLDVVSEEMIVDHAVYDPDCKKGYSLHSSNQFDWWWYSADPAIDFQVAFEKRLKSQQDSGINPLHML